MIKRIAAPALDFGVRAATDFITSLDPASRRDEIKHDVQAILFDLATVMIISTIAAAALLGVAKAILAETALFIIRETIYDNMSHEPRDEIKLGSFVLCKTTHGHILNIIKTHLPR